VTASIHKTYSRYSREADINKLFTISYYTSLYIVMFLNYVQLC
jgi:hypothetical protein